MYDELMKRTAAARPLTVQGAAGVRNTVLTIFDNIVLCNVTLWGIAVVKLSEVDGSISIFVLRLVRAPNNGL